MNDNDQQKSTKHVHIFKTLKCSFINSYNYYYYYILPVINTARSNRAKSPFQQLLLLLISTEEFPFQN